MSELKPEQAQEITFEEFKRIDLRTARILEAREHPQADRLWILKVDNGTETKEIVAGVKAFYTKEELAGRTIILVNNMKPSVIRGVESKGMLLAAKNGGGLGILTVDKDTPPGSPVG